MKKLPTWLWLLIGAVSIYAASIVGSWLHPNNKSAVNYDTSPATSTAYLCSIDSYRQQLIENEIEEVDQRNGDAFDKEAARKRILAVPLATLEANRQADLTFTRKVNRDAGKGEVCPNQ